MRSVILVLVLLGPLAASAAQPGRLWQVESSMEMPGMKMPARSHQICTPVEAEGPEALAGGDERCTMSNVKRSPGHFRFDMRCPEGSGTGEMVYEGRDAYVSTMTITSEGRTMKMVTRGKRVGDCDASQARREIDSRAAAAQAQANAGMAQMCAGMADAMMPANLSTYSCEPKYKDALCRKFSTRAGFREVAGREPTGQAALDSATLPEVARFCGVDAKAMRTKHCGEADESRDLGFLAASCPDQAEPIATRECAGRSFSSPPAAEYREFCYEYARQNLKGGDHSTPNGRAASATPSEPNPSTASTPDPATRAAGEAMKEGARRLKGLFGR